MLGLGNPTWGNAVLDQTLQHHHLWGTCNLCICLKKIIIANCHSHFLYYSQLQGLLCQDCQPLFFEIWGGKEEWEGKIYDWIKGWLNNRFVHLHKHLSLCFLCRTVLGVGDTKLNKILLLPKGMSSLVGEQNVVYKKKKKRKRLYLQMCRPGETCVDVRVGLWRKLSPEELMLLNCGVGEDSWESLGLQGDPASPS